MKDLSQMKRVCSFYVSDIHLTTMILPYLNKQIKQGIEFIVFSQSSLENNIETILSKINIKEEEKQTIKNINWKSFNGINKNEIKTKIEDKNIKSKNLNIIINGENSYIEKMNKEIEEIFLSHKTNKNVTIINCYEVMEFNKDISRILDKHEKILNTSGEKEINEVFNGYKREMA